MIRVIIGAGAPITPLVIQDIITPIRTGGTITAICRTIGQGAQNYINPALIRDHLGVSACATGLPF
ncbi:hypothetical protein QCA50_007651 [Cerrena zonata]|uniref:Uncharacterized protein n=1 Tax=Cerrena zonata TaxID=2478898 RepID=A0AAW0GIY2_9APHY